MVTSLPFLVFSGPITDILGHINVIVLGMSAYAARMLGYSFISDPAHVYPFEALEGFTMALMMTSAVTYVARISGPRTVASVMGLMGALFFGVGKGSGALLGGTVMHFFGARVAFRYFAGNALVCAAAYLAFQCFYVRRRRRRRQQQQANAARGAENGARDAEGGGGEGGEGGETNKAYEDVIPRSLKKNAYTGRKKVPKHLKFFVLLQGGAAWRRGLKGGREVRQGSNNCGEGGGGGDAAAAAASDNDDNNDGDVCVVDGGIVPVVAASLLRTQESDGRDQGVNEREREEGVSSNLERSKSYRHFLFFRWLSVSITMKCFE